MCSRGVKGGRRAGGFCNHGSIVEGVYPHVGKGGQVYVCGKGGVEVLPELVVEAASHGRGVVIVARRSHACQQPCSCLNMPATG